MRNRALVRAQLLAHCVEKDGLERLDERSRAKLATRLIAARAAAEVLQLAKQREHGRRAAWQDRAEPEDK